QIRREVKNGQRAEDLIEALRIELHLPIIDPHLGHYELCFFPGSRRNSGGGRHLSGFLPSNNNNFVETKLPQSASTTPTNILINENLTKENNNSSLSSSPAVLRRVKSHTSIITTPLQAAHRSPVYNCNLYNSAAIQPLHGVENVYAVLMEFVRSQLGISLSDSQLAHLDTCPLVNCKLLLRQTGPNNSPSHSSGHHNKRAALNLVNQFRRVVLGRTDSATSSGCNSPTTNPPPFGIDPNNGKKLKTPNKKQRLFGRQLRGTMPPQPVLTMIDHLLLYGADAEGIFRKSPKQQTVRLLRQQLDMGQVPDFHQFNIHVTASLLKDYLRSIPGQLLLSGNYRLWADVANMSPPLNSSPKSSPSENEKQNFLLHQDRVQRCRKLLALLPPAHTVLLRSVLRLLRKVAQNEAETRMGVSALSVCIAPSLLEKLEQVESVRIIPQLVIFLIEYAHELFDGFLEDGPLLPTTNNNSTNIENNHNHPQSNNQNIPSVPSSSPLHQSTDSGLADVGSAFNVRNAAMGTKRRFILSEHPTSNSQQQKILSQQNPQNQQNQRSVSPDSGKMSSEPPSEDDNDYWRRQQRNNRQIRNSWMLKTHSLDEGGKDNEVINNGGPLGFGIVAPHIDDDIDDDLDDPDEDDDVDLIDSLSSITIRNHYNQFQQEEDSKTPIALSRENSDAKDFRNSNSATTSIIKNNLKNNENNDNKYNINNVEINNNSILTSAASPNFAWRSKHLQQQQKQTYNQHKQRQLNGIRTQQSTNNLIQPLSPTESATPRKVSSTSSIGCNGSEQSYNTNSSNGMSGTAALSRRALIATKSEALLGLNEDERKEEIFNGTRLNLSSNNSPSSQICSPHRVASKGATSQQSSPKMAKAHLQRAIPLNGSALVLNNSSINSSNLSSVNSSLNSSSSPPNPSMLRQRLPVHLETKRQHSTGTLLMMMNNKNLNEKDDISSQPNKKEYCSSLNSSEANNLRRSSASANIEAEGALNGRKLEEEKKHFQLNQNRRPLVQRQQPQQKYIPPRRTAEELLLDKLEVNWSVPQIRKQFQQRDTANEPASAPVIDTLYVKFPGGQQQRQINKKQLV
uniref:Rho-GAP domain-containing protein n=1 Tax=Meloidogyne hapla TaxID=6305 RepID=A0A1I8BBR8_MELHA